MSVPTDTTEATADLAAGALVPGTPAPALGAALHGTVHRLPFETT